MEHRPLSSDTVSPHLRKYGYEKKYSNSPKNVIADEEKQKVDRPLSAKSVTRLKPDIKSESSTRRHSGTGLLTINADQKVCSSNNYEKQKHPIKDVDTKDEEIKKVDRFSSNKIIDRRPRSDSFNRRHGIASTPDTAEEKISTRLLRPSSKRLFAHVVDLTTEGLLTTDDESTNCSSTTESNSLPSNPNPPSTNRDFGTESILESTINIEKEPAILSLEKDHKNATENNIWKTLNFMFATSTPTTDGVDSPFDPFHPLKSFHNHHVDQHAENFVELLEEFGDIFVSCLRSCFILVNNLEETVESVLALAITFLPISMQSPLKSYGPILKKVAYGVEILLTALLVLLEMCIVVVALVWEVIKPFRADLILCGISGLIVCFFGSFFMTTIAAVEALFICGTYQSMQANVSVVLEDVRTLFRKVKRKRGKSRVFEEREKQTSSITQDRKHEEVMQDETEVDQSFNDKLQQMPTETTLDVVPLGNNTNESDNALSEGLALKEKFDLMTEIDTHRLSKALFGINTSIFALVITLKNSFAKTITLGNAISGTIETPLSSILQPLLMPYLPTVIQPWSMFLITYAIKAISISLAWRLRKLLAVVHSAIRGGAFAAFYLLLYLRIFSHLPQTVIDSPEKLTSLQYLFGYGFACLGCWFQFSYQWTYLPFPLNAIFLPFTIIENILIWVMNSSSIWMLHTMSG